MCVNLSTLAPVFHNNFTPVKYTLYWPTEFHSALETIASVVGVKVGESIVDKLQYLFTKTLDCGF